MALRFRYQAEKLSQARRTLMAPHPRGEAEAVAYAFSLCDLAFHDLDLRSLDDDARRWIGTIKRAMDTTALKETVVSGLYQAKADRMSVDDKNEFSTAVDELATWSNMRFWNVS